MTKTIDEIFTSTAHFVEKLFTAEIPKTQLRKWRLNFFIWSLAQKRAHRLWMSTLSVYSESLTSLEPFQSHSKSSKSLWSQTASTNGEPCQIPFLAAALNKSLWWTGEFPKWPKKPQNRSSRCRGSLYSKLEKYTFWWVSTLSVKFRENGGK